MSLDPTDALAMAIVEGRTNPGETVVTTVPAGHSDLSTDSDRSPTGDRREAGGAVPAPAGRAAEASPATLRIVPPPARDRDMPPIPAFLDRTGTA